MFVSSCTRNSHDDLFHPDLHRNRYLISVIVVAVRLLLLRAATTDIRLKIS